MKNRLPRKLKKLRNSSTIYIKIYEDLEKWFLSKIGKRIFRDNNGCFCIVCKRIENKGFIIHDKQHAWYLTDIVASAREELNCKIEYRIKK